MSAASKAKRVDPDCEVIILQDEPVVFRMEACGIPYVIEGIIDNFEELELRDLQTHSKSSMILRY